MLMITLIFILLLFTPTVWGQFDSSSTGSDNSTDVVDSSTTDSSAGSDSSTGFDSSTDNSTLTDTSAAFSSGGDVSSASGDTTTSSSGNSDTSSSSSDTSTPVDSYSSTGDSVGDNSTVSSTTTPSDNSTSFDTSLTATNDTSNYDTTTTGTDTSSNSADTASTTGTSSGSTSDSNSGSEQSSSSSTNDTTTISSSSDPSVDPSTSSSNPGSSVSDTSDSSVSGNTSGGDTSPVDSSASSTGVTGNSYTSVDNTLTMTSTATYDPYYGDDGSIDDSGYTDGGSYIPTQPIDGTIDNTTVTIPYSRRFGVWSFTCCPNCDPGCGGRFVHRICLNRTTFEQIDSFACSRIPAVPVDAYLDWALQNCSMNNCATWSFDGTYDQYPTLPTCGTSFEWPHARCALNNVTMNDLACFPQRKPAPKVVVQTPCVDQIPLLPFQSATSAAPFEPRQFFDIVAMNTSVFVIGGLTKSSTQNSDELADVWVSRDMGEDWTKVIVTTPTFTSIQDHTLETIGGSLFVIGGLQNNEPSVHVWRSDDEGKSWYVCGYLNAGRAQHDSVKFLRGFVVVGGFSMSAVKNDVLFSTDAAHFYLQTASAPWAPRTYPYVDVLRDMLILCGGWLQSGVAASDVWKSYDMVSWTQMTSATPWGARVGYVFYSTTNTLVMMGGISQSGLTYYQDQWVSGDAGATWQLRSPNAQIVSGSLPVTPTPFSKRSWSAFAKTEGTDTLYVIGGEYQGHLLNDVWMMSIIPLVKQVPLTGVLNSAQTDTSTMSPVSASIVTIIVCIAVTFVFFVCVFFVLRHHRRQEARRQKEADAAAAARAATEAKSDVIMTALTTGPDGVQVTRPIRLVVKNGKAEVQYVDQDQVNSPGGKDLLLDIDDSVLHSGEEGANHLEEHKSPPSQPRVHRQHSDSSRIPGASSHRASRTPAAGPIASETLPPSSSVSHSRVGSSSSHRNVKKVSQISVPGSSTPSISVPPSASGASSRAARSASNSQRVSNSPSQCNTPRTTQRRLTHGSGDQQVEIGHGIVSPVSGGGGVVSPHIHPLIIQNGALSPACSSPPPFQMDPDQLAWMQSQISYQASLLAAVVTAQQQHQSISPNASPNPNGGEEAEEFFRSVPQLSRAQAQLLYVQAGGHLPVSSVVGSTPSPPLETGDTATGETEGVVDNSNIELEVEPGQQPLQPGSQQPSPLSTPLSSPSYLHTPIVFTSPSSNVHSETARGNVSSSADSPVMGGFRSSSAASSSASSSVTSGSVALHLQSIREGEESRIREESETYSDSEDHRTPGGRYERQGERSITR